MLKKVKVWLAVCCCVLICVIAGIAAQTETVMAAQGDYQTIAADGAWVNDSSDTDIKYYSFSLSSAGRI